MGAGRYATPERAAGIDFACRLFFGLPTSWDDYGHGIDGHSCERELKARPDYDPRAGTPPTFKCSCGTVAEFLNPNDGWLAGDES